MNSPSPRRYENPPVHRRATTPLGLSTEGLSSLRGHNVVAGMLAPSFRGDGEQRQLPQQG
jgi:hypothetical protein